ncbi:MAG: glycoside hydrolase, partial [Phocaeicola sp.]
MNNVIKTLVLGFVLTASTAVSAQKDTTFVAKGNPIHTHKYLGDPAALVHNGTVYIYAGHDECPAPQHYYHMKEWVILSTKDMKTYTEHEYKLQATSFEW